MQISHALWIFARPNVDIEYNRQGLQEEKENKYKKRCIVSLVSRRTDDIPIHHHQMKIRNAIFL